MYSQKARDVLQKILCCPQCGQSLEILADAAKCPGGHFYQIINNILIFRQSDLAQDIALSLQAWERIHQKSLNDSGLIEQKKDIPYVKSYGSYIDKFFNFQPSSLFLDIGCGLAYNSLLVAQKGIMTVNVDISMNGLRSSQKYFLKSGCEGLFICADMLNLPFKSNTFDFVFSAMSLEYFEDTERAVKNLANLLKDRGSFLAIVPIISFSTIYYQLTGNIVDVPVAKHLAKFIHIKLLRGHFLQNGYDKVLRKGFLKKIFHKYFQTVYLGQFEGVFSLSFLKNKFLKKIVRKILEKRPFWPLVYIYSKK